MSQRFDKPGEVKTLREREEARTAHWLFSRRGPRFLQVLFHLGDQSIQRISPFIQKGQVVADLGCGWGQDAVRLAGLVGPTGKVYAVDLGKNAIQSIKKEVEKNGLHNIYAHVASAACLDFIQDASIDFVFTNGLLCSMAVDRSLAVSEIKRILKPNGMAYLSLGMPAPFGYVNQAEWEQIVGGFTLMKGGSYKELWALVKVKTFEK